MAWCPKLRLGRFDRLAAPALLNLLSEEGSSRSSRSPSRIPSRAPGMRVDVHVDELFVEDAETLLEEVEDRLEKLGLAWEEPLCDVSGP